MKLPIYCINLERASERRERMLEEWKDYDLIFFNAIDRRDLEKDGDILPHDESKTINIIGRTLLSGEKGCVTSYYLLLKQLLDTDEEWFIIGEDDIISYSDPNTFYEWVDKMIEESPDIDVFLMFEPEHHHVRGEERKYSSILNFPPWGTQLQLMSRKGIGRFIDHVENVLLPADYYWRFMVDEKSIAISNKSFAKHINNNTYIGNRMSPFIG